MKKITIYTDGACSGNPGPGGWGAILMYRENSKELSGYEPETTNNRMELTAAIQALDALKEPCEVALYTDSAYLCRAFNERWIYNWMRNGWQTASKKPVENPAGFASNFVVQSTSSMICSGRSSSTNGLRSTPLIYFIALE